VKIGQEVWTSYYLYDLDGDPIGGETANIVTTLEKECVATGEAVTVVESATIVGKYGIYYIPLTANHYELFISHAIYDPSGQGQDWDITTNDIDDLSRVLGLLGENVRTFDEIWQYFKSKPRCISATKKIYASRADCDSDTSPIATYDMTASFDVNGLLTEYKQVRIS